MSYWGVKLKAQWIGAEGGEFLEKGWLIDHSCMNAPIYGRGRRKHAVRFDKYNAKVCARRYRQLGYLAKAKKLCGTPDWKGSR